MLATDGNSQTLLLRASGVRRPESALIIASIVFAFAIGVFLVIRRATGALTAPLSVHQLIATAAGVCGWAIIVRRLTAKPQAVVGVLLCVLLLFAIGCSYPANRLMDWLVWLSAVGILISSPLTTGAKRHRLDTRSSSSYDDVAVAEQVLQQLSRVRTADGKDAIRGTLVAEFAQGERQVSLYVGFCPPFETLPQVEVNVTDDSEADVKLAQVLHNGAQIDVRLGDPEEEPVAVTIEFFAVQSD